MTGVGPGEDAVGWLDEQRPYDSARSAEQIRALTTLLAGPARRVLDLGCGAGRVLVPLVEAGHVVTGIDRDSRALAACRARLEERGLTAELREADFRATWPDPGEMDAVLCLGNTLMTVADVDEAVELFRRAAGMLRAGAPLVVDDCPGEFWPELTEGNWLTGVAESGDAQLVWHPSDAIFALRVGADVRPDDDRLAPADRPLRLWTDGALRLAARAAGLSAAERVPNANLLVMRPFHAVVTGPNASTP